MEIVEAVINRVLRKICGMGRGWAFSGIDFTHFGSREAARLSLHRLEQLGRIRRVMRGVYDYPRESALLERRLSPEMDQVARALARRFGWSIQPDGATAQMFAFGSLVRWIAWCNGFWRIMRYAVGRGFDTFPFRAFRINVLRQSLAHRLQVQLETVSHLFPTELSGLCLNVHNLSLFIIHERANIVNTRF